MEMEEGVASDAESDSSSSYEYKYKFANDSSNYSEEEEDQEICSKERDSSSHEGFIDDIEDEVFPVTASLQVRNNEYCSTFKSRHCSRSCTEKCDNILSEWDSKEVFAFRENFQGACKTDIKNKILIHLHNQRKTLPPTTVNSVTFLLYKGHKFCMGFLSHVLDLSYQVIRNIFKDCETGLPMYVNKNKMSRRESLATVNCIAWINVYVSIHGQNAPDEDLIILPSYLTKAELFRVYCAEFKGK